MDERPLDRRHYYSVQKIDKFYRLYFNASGSGSRAAAFKLALRHQALMRHDACSRTPSMLGVGAMPVRIMPGTSFIWVTLPAAALRQQRACVLSGTPDHGCLVIYPTGMPAEAGGRTPALSIGLVRALFNTQHGRAETPGRTRSRGPRTDAQETSHSRCTHPGRAILNRNADRWSRTRSALRLVADPK